MRLQSLDVDGGARDAPTSPASTPVAVLLSTLWYIAPRPGWMGKTWSWECMAFVFKHVWVLFIAAGFINAAIIRGRAQANIKVNPALAPGYQRMLRWFVICGTIPWVAQGGLVLTGLVPSSNHFLDPASNPFVLAWFGLVFLLLGAFALWVFALGGAEALVKYPGFINVQVNDPRVIKLLVVGMILGAMAGFALCYFTPPEM